VKSEHIYERALPSAWYRVFALRAFPPLASTGFSFTSRQANSTMDFPIFASGNFNNLQRMVDLISHLMPKNSAACHAPRND
jgi:hypothetical protein